MKGYTHIHGMLLLKDSELDTQSPLRGYLK